MLQGRELQGQMLPPTIFAEDKDIKVFGRKMKRSSNLVYGIS
jgi:hypothetical protein